MKVCEHRNYRYNGLRFLDLYYFFSRVLNSKVTHKRMLISYCFNFIVITY